MILAKHRRLNPISPANTRAKKSQLEFFAGYLAGGLLGLSKLARCSTWPGIARFVRSAPSPLTPGALGFDVSSFREIYSTSFWCHHGLNRSACRQYMLILVLRSGYHQSNGGLSGFMAGNG